MTGSQSFTAISRVQKFSWKTYNVITQCLGIGCNQSTGSSLPAAWPKHVLKEGSWGSRRAQLTCLPSLPRAAWDPVAEHIVSCILSVFFIFLVVSGRKINLVPVTLCCPKSDIRPIYLIRTHWKYKSRKCEGKGNAWVGMEILKGVHVLGKLVFYRLA